MDLRFGPPGYACTHRAGAAHTSSPVRRGAGLILEITTTLTHKACVRARVRTMEILRLILITLACCAGAEVFPDWCVVPGTVHVLQNQTCNDYSSSAAKTVQWYAMKGEQEARQILLDTRSWASDLNMTANVSVTFGDLHAENDVLQSRCLRWFEVGYVFCSHTVRYADSGGGWRPDLLLDPFTANKVSLEVSVTTPLWISILVPFTATGSEYVGEINISISAPGSQLLSQIVPVKLTVWNFSLPELRDAKFPAVFSFSPSALTNVYKEKTTNISQLFYPLLIDQRVGGDDLYTREPTDVHLAEMLSYTGIKWLTLYDVYGAAGIDTSMKLKGVCVNFTSELIEKVMNILSPVVQEYNSVGLLSNMFVYGFDEVGPECEQSLRNMYGAIKAKWPQLRTMATLNWLPPTDLPLDAWVLQYENYNEADAAKWVAAGKEQWWYHCIEPSGTAYINTFIERPLMMARLLFWLASAHPVSGWLYYSSVMWKRYPSSSAVMERLNGTARTDFDPANYIWLPRTDIFANGDGNFVYPGASGPIPSIRLMNIRDGFEDAELVRMLTLEQVNGIISPLVSSATNYTLDPLLLEKQRLLAASMIKQS